MNSVITKKIEDKFANAQNSLVLQQSDLSLQSISDMVNSGSIDISPRYQRRERWKEDKESSLIESFLLNIPVPPIYLAEDEYGTYSVIDGKQRVTAINKFLTGELKLKNLDKFHELEGFSFEQMPHALKNALKIRPYLRVVTLLRQSDPDLKHEVFLRLNKAGVPLNSQEIRNVAFRGQFNDLLIELSRNPYLVKQLKSSTTSNVYREMIDVQYVLRYFTVLKYWDSFPGNMDIAMDRFMSENYKNDSTTVNLQQISFETAINFCEAIWGDHGFMKPDGSKRVLQGFYDIQMVSSSLISDIERENAINKKEEVCMALADKLDNDSVFFESVTQFTSNSKNMEYRIKTFTEILKNI